MQKINLFIVDDHKLFREGLMLLLKNDELIKNIYEASNGSEFLEAIKEYKPDLVFMDIDMPELNGIETTKKAIEKYSDLKIIALSMYGNEEYYYKMIEAGAKGFLLKDSGIGDVKTAIKSVLNGSNYFSQELLYNLVKNIKDTGTLVDFNESLSKRELEILYHICMGLSNQEIADKLFLSKRTVDKHRSNILSKTNTKNTASLVMFAIKNKLIEI